MADSKLSALSALTGANVDPAADLLYIDDVSVTTSKKILVSELFLSNASATFTITGTGFVSNPTGTAAYSITNNVVTLYIPPLSGTSNSTGFTLTGLPAAIRPVTAHKGFGFAVTDNSGGSSNQARLDVETDGTCTLYLTFNSAASSWTNTGTKAVTLGTTITYNLN